MSKFVVKVFAITAALWLSSLVPCSGQQNFTTYHYDNLRSGQNLHETTLTSANVNQNTFGKLFSQPVDGQIYGAPLVVQNVEIPGKGMHNVVYVVTENDSVYAFDANSNTGTNSAPLWQVSFINPAAGITTIPSTDIGTIAIQPQVGITSTPVVNLANSTLLVVAATKENGTYYQRLHALSLTTGAEELGGPVVISASVRGGGSNSRGGKVYFDPLYNNQRPALLLNDEVVYIAWASHGLETVNAYHGWVIGYDATTLAQTSVYCVTPNGDQGGIWQDGDGLAADPLGNVYAVVGNGTFDVDQKLNDYGMSYVKLSPANGLKVADYFTPFDARQLSQQDLDLGSGGPLLLPYLEAKHPYLALGSGKDGNLYVVDRSDMGGFNPKNNSQIVEELPGVFAGHSVYSTPAYWQGYLYYWATYDYLRVFQISNGLINPTPVALSDFSLPSPGATPVVTSNGNSDGIVWALDTSNALTEPAVLHALDALSAGELYNSTQAGTRDTAGYAVKFTVPTVINGHAYVGTATELDVYGLLP